MPESPDDIVGHKTFDTGEICPETGFPKVRHEPLTRAEASAIWEAAERRQKERAEKWPDEQSAIDGMFDAYQRLKELGWREAIYCPKDGSHFKVIEPGSTGIHDGAYWGEWPNGHWNVFDGDIWPSHPVLFRLYPEDQAKEDERWARAKEKFRASGLLLPNPTDTIGSSGDNSSAAETAESSVMPTTRTSPAAGSSE